MEFNHIPVMADEVINALNINPDGTYVDGTLGGGGILPYMRKADRRTPYRIDRDSQAIAAAKENLKIFK